MERLTKIANKCGTDKGTVAGVANGYTEFYQQFFEKYDKPTVVEIGVLNGDSIRMINDFYDGDCTIIACDINDEAKNGVEKMSNVTFVHVDQSDRDSLKNLKRVIDNFGGADILIDDASHCWHDHIISMYILSDSIKENGIYIIEDLHLGLLKEWGLFNNGLNPEHSTLLYIMQPTSTPFLTNEENSKLKEKINSVEAFSRKNERQTLQKVAQGRCITAIIKFEK